MPDEAELQSDGRLFGAHSSCSHQDLASISGVAGCQNEMIVPLTVLLIFIILYTMFVRSSGRISSLSMSRWLASAACSRC
jgi:hypothetical protein